MSWTLAGDEAAGAELDESAGMCQKERTMLARNPGTGKIHPATFSSRFRMASPSKPSQENPAKESSSALTDLLREDLPQRKNRKVANSPAPLVLSHGAMLQCFMASLFVTLCASAVVWYVMNQKIVELAAAKQVSRPSDTPSSAAQSGPPAGVTTQLEAMQNQLDAWRRDQLSTQKELREAIERGIVARSAADKAGTVPTMPAGLAMHGNAQAGVERMAEVFAPVTPTQAEFIQLKERNRITAYADEAIATGSRKPLETIVEYIRGSGSDHLRDAAQAEYMRVVRMIQFYQREDPSFRLPVTELFKSEGLQFEADLKPPHLFKLLADSKLSWEVRVRAAILLKSSDSLETNTKLIEALKNDPSLEVAKHAQIVLEQRIQHRFRLFDIPAIEAWAAEQAKGTAK